MNQSKNKKSDRLENKKRSITPKDLLFDLFDRVVDSLMAFERHPIYRVSKEEYAKRMDCSFDSRAALFYLKKSGLIKKVVEGKEKYYELTPKGHKIIAWKKIENVGLNRSEKWDKYFRIVMFDIPNDKSTTRDAIRRKLEAIGFVQMQRSVFVYPFECKKEIEAICYYYSAGKYLKYMIANIIEGEKELIEKFLDMDVLTLEDLK